MRKKGDWTRKELEEEILSNYRAATIPVDIRFVGKNWILDMTAVEKMLRSARLISLMNCECRQTVEGCHRPLHVCIRLDSDAKNAIKTQGAKKVGLREALAALRIAHEAGLVHMAYLEKGKKRPLVICSCCSCCCGTLSALVRFGYKDAVVRSDKIAVQQPELCDDCGECVPRCQFKARQITRGKLKYESAKCFGCGVCLSSCPTGAITLVAR